MGNRLSVRFEVLGHAAGRWRSLGSSPDREGSKAPPSRWEPQGFILGESLAPGVGVGDSVAEL